jgi:hypothetical protein
MDKKCEVQLTYDTVLRGQDYQGLKCHSVRHEVTCDLTRAYAGTGQCPTAPAMAASRVILKQMNTLQAVDWILLAQDRFQ